MEFESYADVIDSFERDDMGYASLTDYINGENIKIKEIEMDVMGDLKKALSSKKDGGLMVAIERFNQGGMAGNKTYHQYHDQYVPMDEESMMYANGGGVGSMMQPKKERVSFRGGGSYQGGSGVSGSAESKGMGGSGSSYSGGGGYSSSSNPSGNVNYGSAARDFVQTLNNNNAIAANQAGTKFTPYGGGSRPQGGIFSNMSFNPLAMLAGIFGGPLAGLLTRGIMMGKDKVGDLFGNFNKTMRGTNPDGTTRTQAEYEQARYDRQQTNRLDKLFAAKDRGYNQIGFGNFTKKTMDFTPGQQAKIDGLLAQGYEPSTARNVLTGRDLNLRGTLNEMPAVNIQGLNNNDYEGEIGAMNNNDFVGLNTNATDMQNYMTDQANFTQPGITPTNLNDFEGIRITPQLNNNDYQLGTPQLNNNDFIGLNTNRGIPFTNAAAIRAMTQPVEAFKNTGPFTAAGNTSPPSSPFTDQSYGIQDPYQQNYLLDQGRSITTDMYQSPNEGEVTASNVESIINNKTPLTKSQEFYGANVRPDFYPGDRLNEIEMENGVITKNTNKLVAPFRLANGGIINLLKG